MLAYYRQVRTQMLNQLRRLLGLGPRRPRLEPTAVGFVIRYPGFPWYSLAVRWAQVIEIRAHRDRLAAGNGIGLSFRFGPGKIRGASISETWPGFTAARSAMEASLALDLPDWWRQVGQSDSSGEELVVYRRPSAGAA
jgi:hypothetical protein